MMNMCQMATRKNLSRLCFSRKQCTKSVAMISVAALFTTAYFIYSYKDFLHRGHLGYLLSHWEPEVDCVQAGYRNFQYDLSAPPDLKILHKKQKPLQSKSKFVVPNIVHYIWYTDQATPFLFHHMLSVLSVIKHIKPDAIYIHTDLPPAGEYWDKVKDYPQINIIRRNMTMCLFGQPVKSPAFETSASDVDRLVVLAESGGIYLDFDVIAIKSFDDLRKYPCTLSLEKDNPVKFCSAVTVCASNSVFLKNWLESYVKDYQVFTWAYNAGQVPTDMWQANPELLHVEQKIMRPNGDEYKMIWGDEKYPWWENYAIHLWYRKWKNFIIRGKEPDFDNIKTWNSTFGAMARNIIYGSYELIKS